MYLVARPQVQAQGLIELLHGHGVKAQWLPLMDMLVDQVALLEARQLLPNYDLIMVTAPGVIDYLADEFSCISLNATLIAPGAATGQQLKRLSHAKIIYPEALAGVNAIKASSLLKPYAKASMLVLGGDQINPQLAKLLEHVAIDYNYISLYQRINIGLNNLAEIEKSLSSTANMGIIITSCQIAKYLFDCVMHLCLQECLQNQVLISIHPQITSYLRRYGIKDIYQTATSDNLAILQLIKGLDNERTRK